MSHSSVCGDVQHVNHSRHVVGQTACWLFHWFMYWEIRGIGHCTKCLGYSPPLCFECDLPSTCVVVWPCALVEGQQKGPRRPLEWRAWPEQTELWSRRKGSGIPFARVGPLSWRPTREGGCPATFARCWGGCNNKNTQANVWPALHCSLICLKSGVCPVPSQLCLGYEVQSWGNVIH